MPTSVKIRVICSPQPGCGSKLSFLTPLSSCPPHWNQVVAQNLELPKLPYEYDALEPAIDAQVSSPMRQRVLCNIRPWH